VEPALVVSHRDSHRTVSRPVRTLGEGVRADPSRLMRFYDPREQLPDFYTAAVCTTRGHVESTAVERRTNPMPAHCLTCGAPVITKCPACHERIRGRAPMYAGDYTPSDFCGCGSPFPWASDQAIAYHIENQLAKEELPEAERRDLHLQLQLQLKVLMDRDQPPKKRAAALMAFKKMAPHAYALSEVALRVFVTAEIQTHIK